MSTTDASPSGVETKADIDLWSGRELRQKLLEYLDRDYFIGHDKLPPGWHPHDIA